MAKRGILNQKSGDEARPPKGAPKRDSKIGKNSARKFFVNFIPYLQ
jgi:hypothetical protein